MGLFIRRHFPKCSTNYKSYSTANTGRQLAQDKAKIIKVALRIQESANRQLEITLTLNYRKSLPDFTLQLGQLLGFDQIRLVDDDEIGRGDLPRK